MTRISLLKPSAAAGIGTSLNAMSTAPEKDRGSCQCSATLALTLACLVFASSVSAAVSISATPEAALLDQRLTIQIFGLKPNAPVRVSAKSQAQDALWWRSDAVFIANDQGQIDLDRQAPQSGSYVSADVMGLFWSMRPDKEPKRADHLSFAIEDFSKPVMTKIDVTDTSGATVSASIERRYARMGVRSVAVHDNVVATLYEYDHQAALPGVLVIGGSDGGPGAPGVAMLLASHGFAAVSLSYFGVAGLPPTLQNVPLEYFQKALQWMRTQPDIDPRSIAIYSESRGTEAALFTAANNSGVSAVVARSPSFAFWSGMTATHLPGKAAWTFQGQPLPYIANTLYPDFILTYLWDRTAGIPVRQTPLFLEDLAHSTSPDKTAIPVEQIHGPVMLLAGADDQIWPSTMMAERIMARLRLRGHAYRDQSVTFADVGHPIPYVYLPTRGNWRDSPFAVGGTPEGMAKAQANAWPQILKFLSDEADRARSNQ
ncbi:MAG: acyl-CoA thioesterase/BAAT N-terminal domain-containing protein [Pseudomonadota bacterium]|nr:acyl-CoA thioesterase/BAAT N-terminal domain-containing protein [Pseudomonadota bacterium]